MHEINLNKKSMNLKTVLSVGYAVLAFSLVGCSSAYKSVYAPNNFVQFKKEDFEYSAQVSGEATETKILGIDWSRLFSSNSGNIGGYSSQAGSIITMIPIIGGLLDPTLATSKVNGYAVYNIIKDNPGYDAVFYPQYDYSATRFLFFYSTAKTKVTTRLAKIKK